MRRALAIVRWLWWAAVAGLPIAMWKVERIHVQLIGCPPRGDCYVPGSEAIVYWDLLMVGTAALLWPVCVWFLLVAPWRRPESN